MLGKIILVVYLLLLNFTICQAQYFNGKIYQTFEKKPDWLSRFQSETNNWSESEFLLNKVETTFCNDTLIQISYGRDSLYKGVVVQIRESNYLHLREDGFIKMGHHMDFYTDEWKKSKKRTNQHLLGFDLDKYEYVKGSYIKHLFVAKNLSFKDSYGLRDHFKNIFHENGLILQDDFFHEGHKFRRTVTKIIIEPCNCYQILESLDFFSDTKERERKELDLEELSKGKIEIREKQ